MTPRHAMLALILLMIPAAAGAQARNDMANMPGMAGMPGMSMGSMTPKASSPARPGASKTKKRPATSVRARPHRAIGHPATSDMADMAGMEGMPGMEGMKPTPKGMNRVINSPAEAALQAFSDALEVGNRDLVVRWLAPDAGVVEGGATETRDTYVSHHMDLDMRMLKDAKRILVDRQVVNDGPDRARVTSTIRLIGNRADRPFDTTTTEVATMEKSSGEWLVKRVEWSPAQKAGA